MRLIVFTQGAYGERILENLRRRAPQDWGIKDSVIPGDLPTMIEEPERIVEGVKRLAGVLVEEAKVI